MKQNPNTQLIIEKSDDTVNTYFASISKISTISADEEAELARQIHLGNKSALDKLVCANLRFVVSIAKQYQNRGMDLADLIEEGNIGLCKAAERFDASHGVKFISFAVGYISQAIRDALVEHSRLVRLPHGQVTILNKIKNFQADYVLMNGFEADLEEIAEALDMEPLTVKAILAADGKNVSFEASLSDECDKTLLDFLHTESDDRQADAALDEESKEEELDRLLRSTLKERDIFVLRHTYGLGCEELSQIEIAEQLGLSRERVRQIRDTAILKLRDPHIHQWLRLCC